MRPLIVLSFVFISITADAVQRDTCYAGLYLKNIYDLKPDEYAFTASFWMWFDYRNIKFEPLNNVEIINSKQCEFTDSYHAPADQKMQLASESAKAILNHDWRLKNYPFDRQLLIIQLEAGLDTTKMIMKAASGNFKLYKGMQLPGWRVAHYKAIESLADYDSDFGERKLKGRSCYSRITYQIEIVRDCWGLFFKLVIGLYISFAVAYLVFFVPPLRDQRFGLSIGGLFAAVGNKYVMDNNIPSTISFSFIDKIHDLTFVFILTTLILSVFSLRIAEKDNLKRAEQFDRRSAILIMGLYFLMNIALIWQARS